MAGVSLSPNNDSNTLLTVSISTSATGNTGVPAPTVPGMINRIYKLFLVSAGTTTITFQDGNTALSGGLPLVANGSIVLDLDGTPWFSCSVGNAFNINNSAAVQISGTVYYTQARF